MPRLRSGRMLAIPPTRKRPTKCFSAKCFSARRLKDRYLKNKHPQTAKACAVTVEGPGEVELFASSAINTLHSATVGIGAKELPTTHTIDPYSTPQSATASIQAEKPWTTFEIDRYLNGVVGSCYPTLYARYRKMIHDWRWCEEELTRIGTAQAEYKKKKYMLAINQGKQDFAEFKLDMMGILRRLGRPLMKNQAEFRKQQQQLDWTKADLKKERFKLAREEKEVRKTIKVLARGKVDIISIMKDSNSDISDESDYQSGTESLMSSDQSAINDDDADPVGYSASDEESDDVDMHTLPGKA